jgi:hypothetical protein
LERNNPEAPSREKHPESEFYFQSIDDLGIVFAVVLSTVFFYTGFSRVYYFEPLSWPAYLLAFSMPTSFSATDANQIFNLCILNKVGWVLVISAIVLNFGTNRCRGDWVSE